MSNVPILDVEGTLYVDVWAFYRDLVIQMADIPEDGAIYKKHLFSGLRDYISVLDKQR